MFKAKMICITLAALLISTVCVSADPGKKEWRYRKGELLVKYKANAKAGLYKPGRRKFQLSKIRSLDPGKRLHHVQIPPDMDAKSAAALLSQDPDVEYAEPNYMVHVQARPNDPDFSRLWGLNNYGQPVQGQSGKSYADIEAINGWETVRHAGDVTVAVIDTGMDLNHPDLAGNLWSNNLEIPGNGIDDDGNGKIDDIHGWNFVTDSSDLRDLYVHGTAVAGVIGAVGDNLTGISGVAWTVKLMPLKGLGNDGYGEVSSIVAAIRYAEQNGAEIINLSLGMTEYSQSLKDAIQGSNALFICAAGNSGADMAAVPHYPAAFDCPNIISVAAVDNTGSLADFSNFGVEDVDLAAPGKEIYSTVSPRTIVMEDHFDNQNLSNWSFGGTFNSWGIDPSDSVCLSDSPSGNLQAGTDAWISRSVIVDGQRSLTLEFLYQAHFESGDYLSVEIQEAGGNWTEFSRIEGSCDEWQRLVVDLSTSGMIYQITFRFRVKTASSLSDGCRIEALQIKSAASNYFSFGYDYLSGTSMAAPYVSGVAALVKSSDPGLDTLSIKDEIESNVRPVADLYGMTKTGGLLNLDRIFTPAEPANVMKEEILPINTFTSGSQHSPEIAIQGNGYAMAVWISEGQNGADGIYAQALDPDGSKIGPETRINAMAPSIEEPDIAALTNNTYIIVYQTDPTTIKGRILDHQGDIISAELTLTTLETGLSGARPAVAGLSDGSFVLVWIENATGFAFGDYQIARQKFDLSGTPEGTPQRGADFDGDIRPDVASLSSGGFAVAWRGSAFFIFDPDIPIRQIMAALYRNDLSFIGSDRMNYSEAAEGFSPKITGLSSGGAAVAWQENGSVKAGVMNNDGTRRNSFTVSEYSSDDPEVMAIAATPGGSFMVTWSAYGSYRYGLFTQLTALNGYHFGEPIQITPPGSPFPIVSAASASNASTMMIAWAADGQDGDLQGIEARKLTVLDQDTDGDGIFDMIEISSGLDEFNADTDGDGIFDGIEDKNRNGIIDSGETSPLKADSDNDGLEDGVEDLNRNGSRDEGESDPLNPDSDFDTMTDGYEAANGLDLLFDDRLMDSDGDGFSNLKEFLSNTGAGDPDSIPHNWMATLDEEINSFAPKDIDGKDLLIMARSLEEQMAEDHLSVQFEYGTIIINPGPDYPSPDLDSSGVVDSVDLFLFCEEFGLEAL